ncbi:MAG: hypothetical protein ABGY96_28455 [bacterium]
MGNAQFFADVSRALPVLYELIGGISGDDAKPGNAGNFMQHILIHTSGEIGIFVGRAQVLEGHNHDGRFSHGVGIDFRFSGR